MDARPILIIGSQGQLGHDCLECFARNTGDVKGIDVPDIDIGDRRQCQARLDELNPKVVINCAAYTAVDDCETEIEICHRVNADGPGHLAEWAATQNAYLVHISTDYVFSGEKPLFQPWLESDEPQPVSAYGRSKLAGEETIAAQGKEYAILRTSWLYGLHGNNFLKTMHRLAADDPNRELKIVADQYGSPTWSRTLARQIEKVVDSRATGIFHATSEGYCNWYDLADSFFDLLGIQTKAVPCATQEYPTPAKRPQNSILENQRLKDLGINVFKDWREDLKSFAEEYKINNHD